MANTRTANVIYVDTNALFTGTFEICGIKFIAADDNSAIEITSDPSAKSLWGMESSALHQACFDEVKISVRGGFYVTISGSAYCYIYLK